MAAQTSVKSTHKQAACILSEQRSFANVEITRDLSDGSFHETRGIAGFPEQRTSLIAGDFPDFKSGRTDIRTNGFTRGIQLPVPPERRITRDSIHRHTSAMSQQMRQQNQIVGNARACRAETQLPTQTL